MGHSNYKFWATNIIIVYRLRAHNNYYNIIMEALIIFVSCDHFHETGERPRVQSLSIN